MFPRPNFLTVVFIVVCVIAVEVVGLYVMYGLKPGTEKATEQVVESVTVTIDGNAASAESLRNDAVARASSRFKKPEERVKAAIVILARNSDINGLKQSISMLEETFNKRFGYPYVFLNDADFTDEFKVAMARLSPSQMKFGKVPYEQWSYPGWIDQNKAAMCRKSMEERRVIYGGSESYRHMCRYNSGFFFRHPLLDEYDYYWRVEPDVKFYCQIEYDPFLFMKKNNKQYGFVITLKDYYETIPTLWDATKRFMDQNPGIVTDQNSLSIIDDGNGGYNLCHYWSNFEIGNLNFFRSEKYLKYFEHLDREGGFFYERWGDAPVHSIAAAMFLPKNQIHYFEDIGYYHGPFTNCPAKPELAARCTCKASDSVRHTDYCFQQYFKALEKRVQ